MIQPNDIASRLEEVRGLIASNKVPQALKNVMDFARDLAADDLIDEATIIRQNYRELENELRREEITRSEARKEKNKLIRQGLGLTKAIVEYADMEAR